ncbi:High mobility group protein TDP-1 [Thelohanellus kitauei]|uniref:High mobility group protein TDP-1 n=1 Tax=Thelohanellus kitauei TaxID=669202 RepID=A0A0C2MP63_THEKT|nr:High mobility group protein TDP-1 [Thelohanellus kitauei]
MKRKSQGEGAKGSKSGSDTKYAKRPLSAFFFFSQEVREDIKKSGGSVSGIENIAKMAGKKWKELSDAEKKPYDKKAQEDKERYERELASGLVAQPRKSKGAKGKKKEAKDPNKPKRATSAYLYFSADFRKSPDAAGIKHTEIMKAAATKWKKLTDAEKKPYLEMEQKDKDRFARESKEYSSKTPTSKKVGKKLSKSTVSAGKESSRSESVDESPDEEEDEDEDEESE